ncbi:MAG: alcohol dehydrogenase catalytic domain-containing protein [Chloroflexi bacterium]|nr:alcohol dehydrogenase catalytic domain-containing protein [Chloroflexota bacterium]
MKVLKYVAPQKIEIAEMPQPDIADGEVLVQTHACGICATDVKTYKRGHPLIKAGSVLGHEMSGVIVESRAAKWRGGERVVVAPYVPCGECRYCRREQFTLCVNLWDASVEPGGFSEYVRVPSRLVQKGMFCLPEHVDFLTATLVEPLACCYHGFEAMRLQACDSLLIVGDGPMGLEQAMIGKQLGASPIVVAGMTPDRLALAANYADHVINVKEQNLKDEVMKLANYADHVINVKEQNLKDEVMKLSNGEGMDRVIVSVGSAEVAEQSVALVRRGGVINFFAGLPGGSRLTIDPNHIHYNEVTVMGTFGFAHTHFKRAVGSLSDGSLDVTGLITRTVTMDEAESAFNDGAEYRGIKSVMVFA